ncbi:hypothetical protein F4604DRAFT_1690940 [Suillus subluteus]|nr:hypothetical protein F4604DRAFT_1690940 [Suillus subluteus]
MIIVLIIDLINSKPVENLGLRSHICLTTRERLMVGPARGLLVREGLAKRWSSDPRANDEGNRATLCCVSFSGTERLIGDATNNRVTMRVSDGAVQSNIRYSTFLVCNKRAARLSQVEYRGEKSGEKI